MFQSDDKSAEAFNDAIKRLGVADDGQTFLDHFRLLITEIGNVLGYVRMIRCGGLNACTSAVQFVPNIESIKSKEITMEELASDWRNSSQETIDAGQNLDKLLTSLVEQFDEGNDYFNQLVRPFQKAFKSDRFDRMKNFFVISKTEACFALIDQFHL